jgi:UDP-N-acetylglucosamine 2-epimerase (non-hydrolysing)
VLERLGIEERKFFLVTMHRAENVDDESRLRATLNALEQLHFRYGYPVLCSLHPRTRAKAADFGMVLDQPGLHWLEPFGFFDFIRLEQSAFCILSDSGTVQEEACIMHVPNVTLRDVTERPETVDCGSNILAGCNVGMIMSSVALATSKVPAWQVPSEYLVPDVSSTVAHVVLGKP